MPRLRAIVLGAAAGGGYPQWNCRCAICVLAWNRDPRVTPRTQSSLAVEGADGRWALLNASPDLRSQIIATPDLHPRQGPRQSPISDVVLTNADIDHVMGLVHLRERQPLKVHAAAPILAAIAANPVFRVLSGESVSFVVIEPDTPFHIAGDVEVRAFAVPGKSPLYLEGEQGSDWRDDGSAIALELSRGGQTMIYAPGVADLPDQMVVRFNRADTLLLDGTVYHDDDLTRAGVGSKSGRRMGHVPIAGAGGSLERLRHGRGRRIYVHLNNTNPVLVAGSLERRDVEARGWEVAHDQMEIVL